MRSNGSCVNLGHDIKYTISTYNKNYAKSNQLVQKYDSKEAKKLTKDSKTDETSDPPKSKGFYLFYLIFAPTYNSIPWEISHLQVFS